ncbi:MAG: hypothetical protein M3P18_15950 [Actinomycetota bacterium]|nr:hypothetical protein [Actinomycetota bacterium]
MAERALRLGPLVLLIATAWPVYVFDDSQAAYLIAVAASGAVAASLAWDRDQLIVFLLLAEVGLLGTEASGALASGTPVLGTARMIDITTAVALATLASKRVMTAARQGAALGLRVSVRHQLARILCTRRQFASKPSGLLLGVLAWMVALWLARGHPIDEFVKTDVRVIGLGLAMWFLARICTEGPVANRALAFCSLAPAISVKALAIYASRIWVIGTDDRLQASLAGSANHPRVILVGGDTLLILMPAVIVLAALRNRSPHTRLWLVVCALSALAGVLISGSRTGLAAGLGLVAFIAVLKGFAPAPRPSFAVVVASLGLGALIVLGAVITGLASRFITPDAPHVGINFRIDELHSFMRLSRTDLLLGQGFGGRFWSKGVNGFPQLTGWSHSFPIWIMLKAGIVGLAACCIALLRGARPTLSKLGKIDWLKSDTALGIVLVVGVLLMSLTLGRAALPEGAMVLGLGIALMATDSDCAGP